MARPKKRRIRTSHSGVKLRCFKRAGGEDRWVARWVNPRTKREEQASMLRLGKTTKEAREQWCRDKAAEIKQVRADLKSGRATVNCTAPAEAVRQFFKSKSEDVQANTLETFKDASDAFLAWSSKKPLACVEDLDGPLLTEFHDDYKALPRKEPKRGANTGRGAKEPGKRKRSKAYVNKGVVKFRNMLAYWRRRGWTPHLTRDVVVENFPTLKEDGKDVDFLSAAEVRKLLEAALRHDAECFDLTREEKAGERPTGSTPKYQPIALFLAVVLLTGARFKEITTMPWSEVDFDQGVINFSAKRVKTKRGRAIDFRETPTLGALLARMKLKATGKYVFGHDKPMSRALAESARKRLMRGAFKAPKFSWHTLRRTTGTFLTCAHGIYKAASMFNSAARLGHSVKIAEKCYVGQLRNIPEDARTLEAALECEDLFAKIAGVSTPNARAGAERA